MTRSQKEVRGFSRWRERRYCKKCERKELMGDTTEAKAPLVNDDEITERTKRVESKDIARSH
jgi:hypothetical protein